MSIQWNRVTWYSQIIAIVLFVGIFVLGLYLGMRFGAVKTAVAQPAVPHEAAQHAPLIETFMCSGGKEFQASFNGSSAKIDSNDGTSASCTQVAAPVNQ